MKEKTVKTADNLIEAAGGIVILICIGISIRMNVVGRSLWLDEAMLAESLNQRSLTALLHPPLAWNQSAPVGYVLVEKLLLMLFGYSEADYRILSIVLYVALLLVFYLICRQVLRTRFPLLCTAGLANIAYLLEYSNMVKPYICDALCVMLVMYLYAIWKKGKLCFPVLCILYAILLWFSNPVAFFTGGVVAYEGVCAIIHKNRQDFLRAFLLGIVIVASFLALYLFWLKPTIAGTNLSEFWEDDHFPLLITNMNSLNKALREIKLVTENIGPAWKAVLGLSVLAVLINIVKVRDTCVWVMTLSVFLALLASHLGFFPMSDRLWLFIIPVCVWLAIFCVRYLTEWIVKPQFVSLVLAVCAAAFLISGTGIQKYHTGEAYRDGEEANPAIAYIQDNITTADQVYVYYPAIPVFEYKNGYGSDSVNGVTNAVYYGHKPYIGGGSKKDIAYVKQQKGIYLLFSHVVSYEPTDKLMKILNRQGTLEKIQNQYLFYYSADGTQSKGRFSYQLLSQKTENGICTAKVRIRNEGDTYLNNGYEKWYLHTNAYDLNDTVHGVKVKDIAPHSSADVTIRFPWNGQQEVTLQLYNCGKYSLDARGIRPLVIEAAQ